MVEKEILILYKKQRNYPKQDRGSFFIYSQKTYKQTNYNSCLVLKLLSHNSE